MKRLRAAELEALEESLEQLDQYARWCRCWGIDTEPLEKAKAALARVRPSQIRRRK